MLKIKVVIVDDESGEQLINEDFHSLPIAICYMETFNYEYEQRMTHMSEAQENE